MPIALQLAIAAFPAPARFGADHARTLALYRQALRWPNEPLAERQRCPVLEQRQAAPPAAKAE